jgi:peptide chain release factor subunit 1
VVAITEEAIRELAAFRGEEAPVTTCYLDVDGRRLVRRTDYERELEAHLRSARVKAGESESVAKDLRRIEDHVKAGIDRSTTRGLAIFSSSAHGLWRVVPLPVPVRTRIIINNVPAVGQLEALVQGRERFGVLLADRQRASMFVFEFGKLTDHSELFEELPRDYDERGHSDQGYDRDRQHIDELAVQHLRHAAQVAFEVHQRAGLDHLTVAGPEPLTRYLRAQLHPYLQERLRGEVNLPVNASLDDIRKVVDDVESQVRKARHDELVLRLRDAVGAGQRGVAGLEPVLRALHDRRVEHLLVSAGYAESGWRCQACGALATVGRTCPVCGAPGMEHRDDVVEEALDSALAEGAKVDVCDGNADLDVAGRIGALLRY